MARLAVASGAAALCLLALGLCVGFTVPAGGAARGAGPRAPVARSADGVAPAATPQVLAGSDGPEAWVAAAARLLLGAALGAALLGTAAAPARADIEDVAVPVDAKGKTMTMTKEQLVRGKRLFLAACSTCHVGGGTRTNQNVGLALEELDGAQPPRGNIESMVDYLNAPMTYDGLKDISEVHPSIKSADLFPKMRSMKQQDLYDMSAYVLYMNFTIPEKWGGGKQYY